MEDTDASLSHVLEQIRTKSGQTFHEADFLLQENRDLAFNHYQRYGQLVGGVPVRGRSIRIWTDLKTGKTIQLEATLDSTPLLGNIGETLPAGAPPSFITSAIRGLGGEATLKIVRREIAARSKASGRKDLTFTSYDWTDQWVGEMLVRSVRAKGRHGTYLIDISLLDHKINSFEYREHPNADGPTEMSIPAQVFPVYEEAKKGEILPRIPVELHYVSRQIPLVGGDIYAPLRNRQYPEEKMNPVLGETDAGRAQGYWAMSYVKQLAQQIREGLPLRENSPESGGIYLEGRYATINIHPDAIKKFKNLTFQPQPAPGFYPSWKSSTVDGKEVYEMIPSSGFLGRPLASVSEALNRPARRLPEHDAEAYLNDGFDELQVYYAINSLFEALSPRGFTDPELSTRPFHAFLYDPDIASRDNAYYTDDTINFTTYSPDALNFARDNSTIWHELGHGVMDRLMGDHLELADTGGLAEGMADFVAEMVISALVQDRNFPGAENFRIVNKTGFHLTNESHDDGEAYGGAMKDLLDASIAQFGHDAGLHKIVDLILEAMRLSRDHPALTAEEWFQHVLFADELGREGLRAPGEMKELVLSALAGRNFKLGAPTTAELVVRNLNANGQEVTSRSDGSRGKPINVKIAKDATADYNLSVALKDADFYHFQYPVQIRVHFNEGALQGAIHWVGEEKGPQIYTLNSEADVAQVALKVTGTCDAINREDGTCVDYAYIQVWNNGETKKPVAKKRFYLHIVNGT